MRSSLIPQKGAREEIRTQRRRNHLTVTRNKGATKQAPGDSCLPSGQKSTRRRRRERLISDELVGGAPNGSRGGSLSHSSNHRVSSMPLFHPRSLCTSCLFANGIKPPTQYHSRTSSPRYKCPPIPQLLQLYTPTPPKSTKFPNKKKNPPARRTKWHVAMGGFAETMAVRP